MSRPAILIVDDEPDIRELLEITLQRMNMQPRSAADLATARQLLSSTAFDLCLTDMRLPDGNGLELLDYAQNIGLSMPIAIITAHGNMDTAIKAMKKGAFDFLSKPIDLGVLRQLVNDALRLAQTETPRKNLPKIGDVLLGESELMNAVRAKINKVACSQAPVYISGESGSGKELVARLIHRQGPRHDQPFIAINCGAIPHELMESEFFGHKKGSFTGAVSDKKGLFQAAEGGTLFLDEVGDLPLTLQVKLLRAIQEKKIRPVGEQQEIPVNIRLLSATHQDLAKMVQEGTFRQDLYYRINVIEISLPPLRARPSDIPQIAAHLLTHLAKTNQLPLPVLSSSALATLKNYAFPGNVRELENILERALALCDGQVIEPVDLNLSSNSELLVVEEFDAKKLSLEEYLENIEKQALSQALEENRWNKTATAKQLGMTFRSLRHRLKKLGLE
jgi:two-component system response regulator PilR (NtrC family)